MGSKLRVAKDLLEQRQQLRLTSGVGHERAQLMSKFPVRQCG
jgi:hypothetical protein